MTAPAPRRRLLVTWSAASGPPRSWELAIDLALRCEAELCAMCIEDLDLLRAAALPFTREVDRLTGSLVAFHADQLERRLRELAAAAEAELAQLASARPLRWSFQTVRGRLREPHSPAGADEFVLYPGEEPPPGVAVLCLHEGGDAGERCLQLARAVASELPLRVVALGQDLHAARRLAETLRARHAQTAIVAASSAAPEKMRELVRQQRAGLCVLPAGAALLAGRNAGELARRLGCPLLVVN